MVSLKVAFFFPVTYPSTMENSFSGEKTLFETVKFQTFQARNLELSDHTDFQISAPECPTHYTFQGNHDVLDIVVERNVQLSDVIVSDILDSVTYQCFSTYRIILGIAVF
jgi:hypothetical protein